MALFQLKVERQSIEKAFLVLNDVAYQTNLQQVDKKVNALINLHIDADTLRDHFIKHNAVYFTEIENATGQRKDNSEKNLPTDESEYF